MYILPSHIYKVQRGTNDDSLGFITHFHEEKENSNFKNRQTTMHHWVTGYNGTNPINEDTFQNIPLTGFKIYHKEIRYYNSNIAWKIQDPRGFIIEVYSDVLLNLINNCTIINGNIQETCIYGWNNTSLKLIPVPSEEYETAKQDQENRTTRVDLKKLKPGDIAITSGSDEITYLGKMYLYGFNDSTNKGFYKSHHFFIRNWSKEKVMARTNLIISKIKDSNLEFKDLEQNKYFINERLESYWLPSPGPNCKWVCAATDKIRQEVELMAKLA